MDDFETGVGRAPVFCDQRIGRCKWKCRMPHLLSGKCDGAVMSKQELAAVVQEADRFSGSTGLALKKAMRVKIASVVKGNAAHRPGARLL